MPDVENQAPARAKRLCTGAVADHIEPLHPFKALPSQVHGPEPAQTAEAGVIGDHGASRGHLKLQTSAQYMAYTLKLAAPSIFWQLFTKAN